MSEVKDIPYKNLLSIAHVPPMFTVMGTLDHAIHELIIAHLKRPGLSGRRFGVETFDGPGFAALLMRGHGTSADAEDEPHRSGVRTDSFCCLHRCGCRCPGLRVNTPGRIPGTGTTSPREASDERGPIHDLRGLDDHVEEHKCPAAAESDDDCRRDGQKIAIAENKFFRIAAYTSVRVSCQA